MAFRGRKLTKHVVESEKLRWKQKKANSTKCGVTPFHLTMPICCSPNVLGIRVRKHLNKKKYFNIYFRKVKLCYCDVHTYRCQWLD